MLMFGFNDDESQATRRGEPKGRYDLGLILAAAQDAGMTTDLLTALLVPYDRASEAGLGGADMAAVRSAF